MTIRISIKSTNIAKRSGTAKSSGKPYNIRTQTAWAHTFDREGNPYDYPQRVDIQLEENDSAYEIGDYTISPRSFFVGDFDKLAISRLILVKAAATGSTSATAYAAAKAS